jgi:Caspase domain
MNNMKNIAVLILLSAALNTTAQSMEGTSNAVTVEVGSKVVVAAAASDIEVTLESLGITKLPKYHALIVGVSEYQNAGPGLPNLDLPARDAEKLYQVLTEKYAFEPQYVTLLKNPAREEIINEFERLAITVSEKDNLLVFYAGHGYYDKAKDFGFWLPADAKKTSRSAWIANSTIKDYLGAIHSKHTLLITDACFGGSIFKTRSVDATIRRFNEMYKDNSRKALTSGNLSEVPDKSVFLKYVLKTLDENNELFLPASTLFTRIYEPILNNTTTTPQFGIIQGAGDEGGDFVFIRMK